MLMGPQIYPGDHLRVHRGAYHHHGIAVPSARVQQQRSRVDQRGRKRRSILDDHLWGDLQVLHYVKDGTSGKGTLQRTDVEVFLGDSPGVELVLATDTGRLPSGEVWHRALAHEGRAEYFLLDSNCEHFSTWCATGHWSSGQVAEVGGVLTVASLAMSWLVVPAALTSASAKRNVQMPLCRECEPPHPWSHQATGQREAIARTTERRHRFEFQRRHRVHLNMHANGPIRGRMRG